jgi:lipoyl(octanoyl) transferase
MIAYPLSPTPEFGRNDKEPVQWAVSGGQIGYLQALAAMEDRVAAIAAGEAPELVWLLEHPALYTAGVSAKAADLLAPDRLPVFASGRGGQYTYHGPGQRVAYVMLDLKHRRRDVRAFVTALETWIIGALETFNVQGLIRPDRVGVWVQRKTPAADGPGIAVREDKIAAIGVKIRRWVSYHGVSLNVEPDLAHFDGIVPCGIREHGVTSLVDLGLPVGMDEADEALRSSFRKVFGAIQDAEPPATLTRQPAHAPNGP